jgi:hypothetical protein
MVVSGKSNNESKGISSNMLRNLMRMNPFSSDCNKVSFSSLVKSSLVEAKGVSNPVSHPLFSFLQALKVKSRNIRAWSFCLKMILRKILVLKQAVLFTGSSGLISPCMAANYVKKAGIDVPAFLSLIFYLIKKSRCRYFR